jgi:hypothetical protein
VTNPYCDALGIRVPALGDLRDHAEANSYALLIVALLESGGPLTLPEVAERFARAAVAPYDAALLSLQRCRPARAPVYRDGDRYALDPHDDEADLWAFRLGLRPPRRPIPEPVRETPPPLPGPDVPLAIGELDEAWRDANLYSWSNQRLALAVLDAHPQPLAPAEIVAFVAQRTKWHLLREPNAKYWKRGAPLRTLEDGRWAIEPEHPAIRSAREAVRDRLALVRRSAALRPDPEAVKARIRESEEERAAHGAELARLRRVLVHAFPAEAPRAVVVVDVAERALTTYGADDLARVRDRLDGYPIIAAVGVRPLLRAIGFDPGPRRLAELGPPQKSMTLNRQGRTLKITTPMLVWGSCGIGRSFGDEARLRRYLVDGETNKLQRRLEADAKALLALYEYGRLHGAVRLRWGFLDEMIPAPWVHRDERTLYGLQHQAHELDAELEVVVGSAPGWKDPWARAFRCRAVSDGTPYGLRLVDEDGMVVDEREIQLARLVTSVH